MARTKTASVAMAYQGSSRAFAFDGTTPGAVGTPLYTFEYHETSSLTGHPVKKSLKMALANKMKDEALFDTFYSAQLSGVSAEATVFTMEDGTEVSFAGADVPQQVWMHIGGVVNGKRKITAFVGVLSGASGDDSYASKSLGDAPVEATAVECESAVTITSAVVWLLLSDLLKTGLTDIVIELGSYGKVSFATAT